MILNINTVVKELFCPEIQRKIIKDYQLNPSYNDMKSFENDVIEKLGQKSIKHPLKEVYSNDQIFKAAVYALGSNSRSWISFKKSEFHIGELLCNYNVIRFFDKLNQDKDIKNKLKLYLPGQTSNLDANGIINWAKLLNNIPEYYNFVVDVGKAIKTLTLEKYHYELNDLELMLCLSGYFANPPQKWNGDKYLSEKYKRISNNDRKFPGMRYILASEFFRNLKWEGFKPDRHIKRLFNIWFPEHPARQSEKIALFKNVIGRRDKEFTEYIANSLIGIQISPTNVSLSQVDNLLWLLGVYVEKKGKESNRIYCN